MYRSYYRGENFPINSYKNKLDLDVFLIDISSTSFKMSIEGGMNLFQTSFSN